MLTESSLISPAAEVRYTFDEQKERAAFAEQVERYREGRDQAFDARLEMGKILLRARQAWPDVQSKHGPMQMSQEFWEFAASLPRAYGDGSLSQIWIRTLMSYARHPKTLEKHRAYMAEFKRNQRATLRARGTTPSEIKTALKMRDAIRNGATLEELETALTEIIGDAQAQPAA